MAAAPGGRPTPNDALRQLLTLAGQERDHPLKLARQEPATLQLETDMQSSQAHDGSMDLSGVDQKVSVHTAREYGSYTVPNAALDARPLDTGKDWCFKVHRSGTEFGDPISARIGRFNGAPRGLDDWRTGGVYLLIWRRPGRPLRVYVGKSGNLASRLRSHLTEGHRDFDEAVLVSTTDTPLKSGYKYENRYHELPGFDEAEIACLESFLLNMLAAVGSIEVVNRTIPNREYIRLRHRGVLAEVALATLLFVSRIGHTLHVPMNAGAQLRIGAPCLRPHRPTEGPALLLVFTEGGPEARCSAPEHLDDNIPLEALWERHLLFGLTLRGRQLVKAREQARRVGMPVTGPDQIVARRLQRPQP